MPLVLQCINAQKANYQNIDGFIKKRNILKLIVLEGNKHSGGLLIVLEGSKHSDGLFFNWNFPTVM